MTENDRPTITETIESLTGYDELAIAKAFGGEFGDLSGTRLMRALGFTLVRRAEAGINDRDAYSKVMGMTGGQVVELFQPKPADDVADLDADFS